MNAPATPTAPQHRAWRRMMLALIVMTISQCCYYESPVTRTWSTPRDLPTYIGGKQFATIHVNQSSTFNYPGKTGWQLHTRAPYILPAMFVLFGLLIDLGPWWTRWGYWVGVLGLLFCMSPFHLESAPGYGLLFGCIAVLLGISAARLRNRAPAPPPPIPVS